MTTSAAASLAPPAASLAAPLSFSLRILWLALQVSSAVLAVIATPALHEHYTTTCAEAICSYIAQPNANTVDVLQDAGIPLSAYATFFVALDWLYLVLWAGLGSLIVLKRHSDTVAMALALMGVALGSYLSPGARLARPRPDTSGKDK
jgi:hypothetical protein